MTESLKIDTYQVNIQAPGKKLIMVLYFLSTSVWIEKRPEHTKLHKPAECAHLGL